MYTKSSKLEPSSQIKQNLVKFPSLAAWRRELIKSQLSKAEYEKKTEHAEFLRTADKCQVQEREANGALNSERRGNPFGPIRSGPEDHS